MTGVQTCALPISRVLSENRPLEAWVLDSGAAFHSCNNTEIMDLYTSGDFGKVCQADGEPLQIIGKGDVRVQAPNDTVIKLRDVRHISELKRNLISIGQLDDEGFVMTFGCSSWKLTKGAMVIARGKKEGTLYITSNIQNEDALAGAIDADLWRCRLDHKDKNGMKSLCSQTRPQDRRSL